MTYLTFMYLPAYGKPKSASIFCNLDYGSSSNKHGTAVKGVWVNILLFSATQEAGVPLCKTMK